MGRGAVARARVERGGMNPERKDRFWQKVEKHDDDCSCCDGCWHWTASKDGMGYGLFGTRPSRAERAHRVAWLIGTGESAGALCVLHRCDNPACVRLDHLFLGTRDDNMRDRQAKRRQARGEQSGRARLSAAQVLEARSLRAAGAQVKDIAAKFEVAPETMSAAIRGRSWSHL